MAFSNVQTAPCGIGKMTVADWTFTQAAATDSISLEGGRLWCAILQSQDTTGAMLMHFPRVSVSGTSGKMTVTIYAQEGVTTGQAMFIYS